jgi:flagellar basal-body rod protein FlgB
MAIHLDKALGLHAEALKLRGERTKILASNLANESTPGFQARDIDFTRSLEAAIGDDSSGLSLETDGGAEALYRVPNQPSQDGNTVELGVEQAAFSQNVSDFQTSLAFINMKLRGIKQAIEG